MSDQDEGNFHCAGWLALALGLVGLLAYHLINSYSSALMGAHGFHQNDPRPLPYVVFIFSLMLVTLGIALLILQRWVYWSLLCAYIGIAVYYWFLPVTFYYFVPIARFDYDLGFALFAFAAVYLLVGGVKRFFRKDLYITVNPRDKVDLPYRNPALFLTGLAILGASLLNPFHRPPTHGSTSLPRWSADGKRILYLSQDLVYAVNADGTAYRQVNDNNESYAYRELAKVWLPTISSPLLSPDGSHLALLEMSGNLPRSFDKFDRLQGNLYTTAADGSLKHLIAGNVPESGVAWSPDSKQIAFEIKGRIYVANVDGSNQRLVAPGIEMPDPTPYIDGP